MNKFNFEIVEYKKTLTKKFFSNKGHLVCSYRGIPKIDITSRCHNDYNQHFCGGWEYFKTQKEEIKRALIRVSKGLKPAATLFPETKAEFLKLRKDANDLGLFFASEKHFSAYKKVYICQKNKNLIELMGVENWKKASALYGFEFNQYYWIENIQKHYLIWDSDSTHLGIKGLWLGYPIDISYMLCKKWR